MINNNDLISNEDKQKCYDALNKHLANLQECQESKSQSSCMPCDNYIDCSKRKFYVKSVYDSMGDGNCGFEF